MQIDTKDYGTIDINQTDIIQFSQGLYGFEQNKSYVVLGQDGEGIMQLQSVEEINPRMIILDPFIFIKDYNPVLPKEVYSQLEAGQREELCIFVIAVIPDNYKNITVNLKSPVVINFDKRLGVQVILEENYSMRYKPFSPDGGMLC
ncbi:MAG: flagellar assembly protein FliW [Eubacteriales bacterium]